MLSFCFCVSVLHGLHIRKISYCKYQDFTSNLKVSSRIKGVCTEYSEGEELKDKST